MIKTRFCPSPTGYIHLGNVRTALFNALLAHHLGGVFLLRIEDTDQSRSKTEYVDALAEDLRWLGLDWQEGIDIEGDAGPYYQSQRETIYQDYYQQLQDSGRAYPCFCTPEQLALSRKLQRAAGKAPRYAGTCRHLSGQEIKVKLAEGLKPTLRFCMPDNQMISFTDIVKGEQQFASDDIGDFIIRRADGGAAFMFCNAIDDSMMGVTHALRGEDHLTNTPRQVEILRCLGLREPQYGHISLIVGQDGAPLSKRNGSHSVRELRELGYFPQAVVNYLARLGHYYTSNDYMNVQQLADAFKTENLSQSPARYDEAQLNYWQKESVSRADAETLHQWLATHLDEHVPAEKMSDFINTVKANITFPEEAKQFANAWFAEKICFSEQAQQVMSHTHADYFACALNLIEQHGVDYAAIIAALKQQLGIKGKALFQPLRIALTGQLHGPELAPIMQLLGEQRVKQRLQTAIQQIM